MTNKKRYRNKEHMLWVKQRDCLFNHLNSVCNGLVQAHHLLKPWEGEIGMGMKSNDKNVIPLCYYHHALLHDTLGTEAGLFLRYGLNEFTGIIVAEKLWLKSPHNPDNADFDDNDPF